MLFATAKPGYTLVEIEAVLDEEMQKLADAGPTQRELDRFRNAMEAHFIEVLESLGGMSGRADQLNHYNYFVGNPDFIAQDFDRYKRLTPADVQRVAKTYLTTAHRVALSIVPTGKPELAVAQGRS